MAGPTFAERVRQAVRGSGTPLIVGIDPAPEELPAQTASLAPADRARVYGLAAVEAARTGGATGVKVQAAFFEALGPEGLNVFAEVLRAARGMGLLTIADVKRSDVGHTAKAYARAYLGPEAPFRADAVTVTPYVGSDGVRPFLEAAARDGSGVLILVRTSNVGGNEVQQLIADDGARVFERVAALLPSWIRIAGVPPGTLGVVIGATQSADAARLRAALPDSVILAPGFGAQGGEAVALQALLDDRGGGLLVPVSRGISQACRDARDWRQALVEGVTETKRQLRVALPSS